jgi:hypothetical protein
MKLRAGIHPSCWAIGLLIWRDQATLMFGPLYLDVTRG